MWVALRIGYFIGRKGSVGSVCGGRRSGHAFGVRSGIRRGVAAVRRGGAAQKILCSGGSGTDGAQGGGGFGAIIPASAFGVDGADGGGSNSEPCLRPSSALVRVAAVCPDAGGGGPLLCDAGTASALAAPAGASGTSGGSGGGGSGWTMAKRRRLGCLRHLLAAALEVLGDAVPACKALLPRVAAAVDAPNTSYDAFCDG